ncbi:8285_t:CDS:2 [Entrophospora sp. SA101]|nr:8285_t:CDS:2 [Entrophospora sp. SA101]
MGGKIKIAYKKSKFVCQELKDLDLIGNYIKDLELNAATLVNGEKSAKFITGGKLLDSDSRCFEAYCCEPLKMRMGELWKRLEGQVQQPCFKEVLVLKVGMYLYLIPENINHYHEQSNLQNHRNYKSKIQGSAEDVDKKVVESLISQVREKIVEIWKADAHQVV